MRLIPKLLGKGKNKSMNVLTSVVLRDGYSYEVPIEHLSSEVIAEAEDKFNEARAKGIVIADSFWADQWRFYDESKSICTISFRINEIRFQKVSGPLLGCSLKEFKAALRVLVTAYLGASLNLIREVCNTLVDMFNALDHDYEYNLNPLFAPAVKEFLTLLPGETLFAEELIEQVEQIMYRNNKKKHHSRNLCYYQSYLRFDGLLNDFWSKATQEEKVLFFPIYFWWKVSSILPLRPIEVVLTPRECIERKNDKVYLIVRRTLRKGTKLSCRYTIEDDYEKNEYPIPAALADEIEKYIRDTEPVYDSEIDNLFCKVSQYMLLNSRAKNKRYLYADLRMLLDYFYLNVILTPKYEYTLRSKGDTPLSINEIEKISLGDTRHIAMISLMTSGNSAAICMALAGHDLIETGQSYYGNVKKFVDALVWERVLETNNPKFKYDDCKLPDHSRKVSGGYCYSPLYHAGDYSDCAAAVSDYGQIGHCQSCEYFKAATGEKVSSVKVTDERIKNAFLLVLNAIKKANRGTGTKEDVQSAVGKFNAEVIHYTTQQGLRIMEEMRDSNEERD